ncbi:hypothetical protein JCM10908_002959 [Rhodotorula pacifica]|uniref:uncharacterized protein n=1 Tax=Rhodotorula pacifica TaxID=1495444 RepID=UPI003180381D
MSSQPVPTRRTASPDSDPGARWQEIREQWLARPAPSSNSSTTAISSGVDAAASPSAGSEATPEQSTSKRVRDPVFQQRIATLEQLLREANALATGTSPAKLSVSQPRPPDLDTAVVPTFQQGVGAGEAANGAATKEGKGLQEEPEEEPDGGMPIRDHGAQGDPTHDLKKVSESIFLAFKQGRPLREPLPLALVTSLLFRSWYLDGTIPADYKPEAPTLPPPPIQAPIATPSGIGAPMPIPRHVLAEEDGLVSSPGTSPVSEGSSYLDARGASGGGGSSSRPGPAERRPSLLVALAERNSNAVTPLPSSDESDQAAAAGGAGELQASTVETTPSPSGASAPSSSTQDSTRPGARPIQIDRTAASGAASRSPSLEGMGASSASGKLQLDLLRGSRWRTEQEVASGSDVI